MEVSDGFADAVAKAPASGEEGGACNPIDIWSAYPIIHGQM